MTNVWVHDPSIPRDVQSIFDPFGNAVHTALSFDRAGRGRADHRGRARSASWPPRWPGTPAPDTSSSPTSIPIGWTWPSKLGATLAVDVRKQ